MSMSRAFASSLADFQVTTIGRFWVTAEVWSSALCAGTATHRTSKRKRPGRYSNRPRRCRLTGRREFLFEKTGTAPISGSSPEGGEILR